MYNKRIIQKVSFKWIEVIFVLFFAAILGYFSWKPGQSCSEIKTIEGERAVSAKYWLNKTAALFQVRFKFEQVFF